MAVVNLRTGPQGQAPIPNPDLLMRRGPILPVEVTIHTQLAQHLEGQGQQLPQSIVGTALIDTGASITAVDRSVVKKLNIPPMSVVTVSTPSGQDNQTVHAARFIFPAGVGLPTLEFNSVIAADLSGQNIIALLGRDVLQYFLLVYNGPFGDVMIAI